MYEVNLQRSTLTLRVMIINFPICLLKYQMLTMSHICMYPYTNMPVLVVIMHICYYGNVLPLYTFN